jgi:flavin reductase (DIM6/NTAB) family NADH-FMN oxidoreductase RutF
VYNEQLHFLTPDLHNMTLTAIPPETFTAQACSLWSGQWLLLSAGDFAGKEYNCMTVGWGSLGTMWNKPFAQVVVRPSRYTYEFMERFNTFTLCAFPPYYRDALLLLGTKSGRDGDKIAEAGLTPCEATIVAAPVYDEAELTVECQKIYWQDMAPEQFLDNTIFTHYPAGDYHRVYFGEITAVAGINAYTP